MSLLGASEIPRKGSFVLLWVQQDVRAECNHALEVAVSLSNALGVPLLAAYGLFERYPGATERSFAFLLDGLAELKRDLASRGVRLIVGRAPPPDVILALAREACAVVCDAGYTRVVRGWRKLLGEKLSASFDCPLLQVETNVVVPIRVASLYLEPVGATLRPKIMRQLPRFTQLLPAVPLKHGSVEGATPFEWLTQAGIQALDVTCPEAALACLEVDRTVPRVPGWQGGQHAALDRLRHFAEKRLSSYRSQRKDPVAQCQSQLSPYFHFGHISSLQVIHWLRQHFPGPDTEAWVDELVVRRELARNMVFYNQTSYDTFDGVVPAWAARTLEAHSVDPRPRLFSRAQLELGQTDDPAWNAAQHEMVASGHMHNYMRMYWCKQLLLWTASPREAFETAVWLNDRWELDGRDENGYMGIAWCFGNHDSEFPERPIFGTVRSMTRSGLKSKIDEAKYIELVRKKCSAACAKDERFRAVLPQPKGILSFFGRKRPPQAKGSEATEQPTEAKCRRTLPVDGALVLD